MFDRPAIRKMLGSAVSVLLLLLVCGCDQAGGSTEVHSSTPEAPAPGDTDQHTDSGSSSSFDYAALSRKRAAKSRTSPGGSGGTQHGDTASGGRGEELHGCGDGLLDMQSCVEPLTLQAIDPQGKALWDTELPKGLGWAGLQVAGERLYALSDDTLVALAAGDKKSWTAKLYKQIPQGAERPFVLGLGYLGMSLFLPGPDSGAYVLTVEKLRAYDSEGQERWSVELPNYEQSTMQLNTDGTLYLLGMKEVADRSNPEQPEDRSDCTLRSFSPAGEELWHYDFSASYLYFYVRLREVMAELVVPSPAGPLLVASENSLIALDTQGHERWKYEMPDNPELQAQGYSSKQEKIMALAAGPAGELRLVSASNKVYALDAQGKLLFCVPCYEGVEDLSGIGGNRGPELALGADGVLYGRYEHLRNNFDQQTLWALSRDGKPLWRSDVYSDESSGGPWMTPAGPLLASGSVRFGAKEHRTFGSVLQQFDSSGKLLWEEYCPGSWGAGTVPVAGPEGQLYVAETSRDGSRVFRLPDAKALWKGDGKSSGVLPGSLQVLSDGTLVFLRSPVEWQQEHCK